MNFTLYKQRPRPRKTGVSGYLAVHDSQAFLFDSDNLPIAQMDKPEIKFINQDGIMLRGFEPVGYTASGVQKWEYQEWLLRW